MQTTYSRTRRWTRVEYDRLIDQEEKGSLYARAHVADYWIVAGQHVAPLAVPASHIAVVDLLP